MNALVTGVAGFIGSHLAGPAARARRDGHGHRLLHRLLPAGDQGANLAGLADRAGFTFVESTLQDADLGGLLDGVTHVFHLAAQAGVRKSWGRDFHGLHGQQHRGDADAARGLPWAGRSSGSSTRRARRSTATTWRSRCARTRCRSRVSPYGVTKLAAEQLCYSTSSTMACRRVSLRYFTVYGPRQRPDMGFHRFLRAPARRADHRLRRRRADPRLHVRRRRGGRDGRRGAHRASRARVQYRRRVPRLGQPRARHHRPGARPAARSAARAEQKGDMRDTYADTTLARRELGFSPQVCARIRAGRRTRLDARSDGAWPVCPPEPALTGPVRAACRGRLAARERLHMPDLDDDLCGRTGPNVLLAGGLVAADPPRCRGWGRGSKTGAAPGGAGGRQAVHNGAQSLRQKKWLQRGSLPPDRGQLPAEPLRADAKLGLGDTYLRRRRHRRPRARHQRVPGVPDVLPDASPGGLRADTGSAMAHHEQM